MNEVPHTAMVLAAGLGTRMRPLTDNTPKPLLKVADRALIDRALDPLRAAGVRRFVVNVHYLANQVEDHFAQIGDTDVILSDERGEVLETGGAIAKAREHLGDDPILVVNTDAFWAPGDADPLIDLARAFDPDRMDELLLLADTGRCLGFGGAGDFFADDQGCLKLRGEAPSAPWAYAGVRLLKPQLYDDLPIERFSARRVWTPLLDTGRMFGVPLDRFWLHVGDPKALEDAEMWIRCHGG